MRKVFTFLVPLVIVILITTSLFAQSPEKLSYQAVIRNSSNVLVSNAQVGMQFSILQGSTGGSVVYTETQTPTTNANGLVSIEIGGGAGFNTINWSAGPYFIKTETDPAGGTSYTITGTNQLLSVPYALYAKNGLTPTQAVDLANTSGYNTGDQDLSLLATKTDLSTGLAAKVNKETGKGLIANGTVIGQMVYWNGSVWAAVANPTTSAPGNQAPVLHFCNGVPSWEPCPAILPTITTLAVINNEIQSSGGVITNDGGADITSRGVCYGTNANPTILNSKTSDGAGIGTFTSSLTGLISLTKYYVRAYATNSAGTSYGNEFSFTTNTFLIGQNYQGGIIFYIEGSGTGIHGLIAAPSDQSGAIWWHSSNTGVTNATGTLIGTGNANTNAIIALYGAESNAARICYDLVLGVYSDWYLPSSDELDQLYRFRAVIGGFIGAAYWNSSEYSAYFAKSYDFLTPNWLLSPKTDSKSVRAIRAF